MKNKKRQLSVVCGAGGFIGGHLVADLIRRGHGVRAVDLKPLKEWQQVSRHAQNQIWDLRVKEDCLRALQGATVVYNLAADMGGMGFIENNRALCMLNVLINTHLLMAARHHKVKRYFFASSACVYNALKQKSGNVSLREEDAYPAMPEDGYGWEKLFSERMCRHFQEDFGLRVTVARLHNVYGPYGSWKGGREKAPAAICRKVIEAQISGRRKIEIWGNGRQVRSFMYIDDCIEGIHRLMRKGVSDPINLGSHESVSINQLVSIVENIGGVRLRRSYDPAAPKGVAGRNSDNRRIRSILKWEPSTPLRVGLKRTYQWIYEQMAFRD